MQRLLALAASLCLHAGLATAQVPTYTVAEAPRNTVDDRLFGAFLEKATWGGEIGADAAIDPATGTFRPEVLDYLEWMQIPLIRFPGGTAIDYYPWWRLVDSFPGEHGTRPRNAHYKPEEVGQPGITSSDGSLGLHEFIDLCARLDAEPLLVVNVGVGYRGDLPLAEAAERYGADFVRYCNATSGPMAELRAANGHPEPFGVELWQIGNETWGFAGLKEGERTDSAVARLAEAEVAYLEAMHAADPSIRTIIDGAQALGDLAVDEAGQLIDYLTFHQYAPWGVGAVLRDGDTLRSGEVGPDEMWRALASIPGTDSATGLSRMRDYALDSLAAPLAMTEWNLNGWFSGEAKFAEPDNRYLAYGMGAGSYLNAMLRASDRIRLACQSMLVGTSWGITGVRVDSTGEQPPVMHPTALATGLYSREHGDRYHEHAVDDARTFAQPLRFGVQGPSPRVAEQDVAFTADDDYFYAHVLNRAFAGERAVRFRFPENVATQYTHFLLSDRTEGARSPYAAVEELDRGVSDGPSTAEIEVTLPPRSLSVVKFARAGAR